MSQPTSTGRPRRRRNAAADRETLEMCAKLQENLKRVETNIAALGKVIEQIEALAEQERAAHQKENL